MSYVVSRAEERDRREREYRRDYPHEANWQCVDPGLQTFPICIEEAANRITEDRVYAGDVVWFSVEDERVTEETKVGWLDTIPKPECKCGFFPNDECPIDHMGRNKPDPEKEGGLR